jgi:hypothetical protein
VYLEPYTCEPVVEAQRYELEAEEEVGTPVGRFLATRWKYTSLGTGWMGVLWIAGEVVVAFEGLFALEEYDPGARGPVPA